MSPVVAAGFGVVPMSQCARTIEVASARDRAPGSLAALAELLKRKVKVHAVHEALVHHYISRLYLQRGGVDFPTFSEPGFLENSECVQRLGEQKSEEVPELAWGVPSGSIGVLDYDYRTDLRSLDAAVPPLQFQAAEPVLPFAWDPAGESPATANLLLGGSDLPGADAVVIARESYLTTGMEYAHGWRRHELTAQRFVVHPSEIQVVGVGADGRLQIYAYGVLHELAVGGQRKISLDYYFLSMGQRLRRQITLTVLGWSVIERQRCVLVADKVPWTPVALARWFGRELQAQPSIGV